MRSLLFFCFTFNLFILSFAYTDAEDFCAMHNGSCLECVRAANDSVDVICYSCGDSCLPVEFQGIVSNRCSLSETHIWSCSVSGLGFVILVSVGTVCLCCACVGLACFVCLCCISTCSKRQVRGRFDDEATVRLIGEQKKKRREERRVMSKLRMERYAQDV